MINTFSFFTSPPRVDSPVGRILFLVFLVGLLAWHLSWMGQRPWAFSSDRHRIFAFVIFALVLNHLAFRFPWPRVMTAILRVIALVWLGALVVYWLTAMYR